MALPWALGQRKLPHTWTWLWKDVAWVGLKEAEKLLKGTGNYLIIEPYGWFWVSSALGCAVASSGCRGEPVREPVRGGRPLCGGWLDSPW